MKYIKKIVTVLSLSFLLLPVHAFSDESYEVTIPQKENTTRILIPIDIPTHLLANGAVELYASNLCNWTPQIRNPEYDSDPENKPLNIDNPESSINAAALRIRKFVLEEFRSLIIKQGEEAGRQQAVSSFDSFF